MRTTANRQCSKRHNPAAIALLSERQGKLPGKSRWNLLLEIGCGRWRLCLRRWDIDDDRRRIRCLGGQRGLLQFVMISAAMAMPVPMTDRTVAKIQVMIESFSNLKSGLATELGSA